MQRQRIHDARLSVRANFTQKQRDTTLHITSPKGRITLHRIIGRAKQ